MDHFVAPETSPNAADSYTYYFENANGELSEQPTAAFQVDWPPAQTSADQTQWFADTTHTVYVEAATPTTSAPNTAVETADAAFDTFVTPSSTADLLLGSGTEPQDAAGNKTVPTPSMAPMGLKRPMPKSKTESRPTKPVSAYALFFRDTHASIKLQNPSASFAEISKIVAAKWEELGKPDKDVYKERADNEKRTYLHNLASTKAKQIATAAATEAVPPPAEPSAFLVSPQDPLMAVGQFVEQQHSDFGLLDAADALATFDPLMEYESPAPPPCLNPVMSQTSQAGVPATANSGGAFGGFGQPAAFFDDESAVGVDHMIDLNLDLHDFDLHLYSPHDEYLNQLDDEPPGVCGGPYDEPTPGALNGHPAVTGAVCARTGCERDPVESAQWDGEFCSEECCVRYCADVFRAWTGSRRATANPSETIPAGV